MGENGASVVFVDDDPDLRSAAVELLASMGISCLGIASHQELVSCRLQAMQTSLTIIDINLGLNQPTGLDAYQWLKQNSYSGKIVFLTGHARSNPLVARASELDGVEVFQKPIEIKTLVDLLERSRQKPGQGA